MKTLVTLVFLGFTVICTSQKNLPEPAKLRAALSQAKADTTKVTAMLRMAKYYYDISQPAVNARKLDSAVIYIKKAEKLSAAAGFQNGLGKSYVMWAQIELRRSEKTKALYYAKKAIRIFKKVDMQTALADAYLVWSYCESSDEVFAALKEAEAIFSSANNKKGIADVARQRGFCFFNLSKNIRARNELQRSLTLYKQVGFENVQMVHAMIGVTYNSDGDLTASIADAIKAMELIDRFHDTSAEAAAIYNYIAVIYSGARDMDKSLEYLKKSHYLAQQHQMTDLLILLETNFVQILFEQQKFKEGLVYLKLLEGEYKSLDQNDRHDIATTIIEAYSYIQEYKQAEKYVPELMAYLSKPNPSTLGLAYMYSGILRYYVGIKDYRNSMILAERLKKICEEGNYKVELQQAFVILSRIEKNQGNYPAAMEYLAKSQELYNDDLNESKNQQISELQIKYDTEKKENSNKILTQKNQLQQAKLDKASFVRNIGVIGILLLLAFLIVLYSRYAIKRRSNLLLQSQKVEIDDKNIALQHLVTEKEWLLKEIHHRVKNNLQTIMSLLNTQTYFLKDEAAMDAIRDSQHRIHSMSLIHKKLYQSENVVAIDMPNYIKDLIEYFRSFFETRSRIRFVTNIDAIALDITQAVPVGLILNEAITNSIKHAFPNDGTGTISITMKLLEDGNAQLTISDDGVGDEKQKDEAVSSLGMKLINGFSSDLDGHLDILKKDGFTIVLTFEIKVLHEDGNQLTNISA